MKIFLTYDHISEWEVEYYKQQITKAKAFKKSGKTVITWDEFFGITKED